VIAVPVAVLIVLLGPALAAAEGVQTVTQPDPNARTLGVFASVGYLGSPGASGAAVNLGVRWRLNRNLALSADYGYGMIGASGAVQDPSHEVEDRWWIMPAVAWVIPTTRVQLDLGAGVGLATASGYPSWSFFGAAPFGPVWAFQLVPAVRVHALAAMRLTGRFEIFARVDAGSLLLGGNSIGIRSADQSPGLMDTTWLNLSLGLRCRLF
jgi:hypothetical protein